MLVQRGIVDSHLPLMSSDYFQNSTVLLISFLIHSISFVFSWMAISLMPAVYRLWHAPIG